MARRKKPVLSVKLISMFDTLYEGEAYSVTAIDSYGGFDVLPGHENFIALLNQGRIKLNLPKGEKNVDIHHGIIQVTEDRVDVFANI